MKIEIPNKENINFDSLKKVTILGIIKPTADSQPAVGFSRNISINDLENVQIEDNILDSINFIQFKFTYDKSIKIETWYKEKDRPLNKSNILKISIPERIISDINKIEKLYLETAKANAEGESSKYESVQIALIDIVGIDFIEIKNSIYEKCAKIQYKILYKNGTTEFFKFSAKEQSVYKSKLSSSSQLCVRHKVSDSFVDSDDGRRQCLEQLNTMMFDTRYLDTESKGSKNLIYYTVYFDNGYVELLNKSICSILKNSKVNFDLLLITDLATKDIIVKQEFIKKITPKFLITETPFDGVEASQNKVRIFEFKDVRQYDKILFLDCDIISLGSVNDIFNKELQHNTLYTARNSNLQYWHHKTYHHGFEFLGAEHVREMTNAQQMPFNAGQFLFKMSDRMLKHFNNIKWFIDNWSGEYFFEQAFMNYYFCKAYITDDSILQKYMTLISTTNKTEYSITNDTRLVHFIAPPLEAKVKLKFIDQFITSRSKEKAFSIKKVAQKIKNIFKRK